MEQEWANPVIQCTCRPSNKKDDLSRRSNKFETSKRTQNRNQHEFDWNEIADALENVHDASQNREAKEAGAGREADGLHARGGQRPR